MTILIAKPIFWNTKNYLGPSGFAATGGWPEEHGFAHEEWNNSPQFEFEENGKQFHVFHTEDVGDASNRPPEDNEPIVLFMYASHNGLQELVGVAGNAICLINQEQERKKLVKQLEISNLKEETWDLDIVKKCHDYSRGKFEKIWNSDINWIPNWICPTESFLWLNSPALINSETINGKSKLQTRYKSHTKLDVGQALNFLKFIPLEHRNSKWHRICSIIDVSLVADLADLNEIINKPPSTTQKRLTDERLGQDKFRSDLERIWENRCSVSGCDLRTVLRASHIKPWRDCTNAERLDPNNGLLLTAELDALFDNGLISFDDSGCMLISEEVSAPVKELFQLPRSLREKPTRAQLHYLEVHRNMWGF